MMRHQEGVPPRVVLGTSYCSRRGETGHRLYNNLLLVVVVIRRSLLLFRVCGFLADGFVQPPFVARGYFLQKDAPPAAPPDAA